MGHSRGLGIWVWGLGFFLRASFQSVGVWGLGFRVGVWGLGIMGLSL